MRPTRIGEGNLHFSVDGLKCSSYVGTLHGHTQNSVELNLWAPLDPVKLTHKVKHPGGERIALGLVYRSDWGGGSLGTPSTRPLWCMLISFLTIVLLS